MPLLGFVGTILQGLGKLSTVIIGYLSGVVTAKVGWTIAAVATVSTLTIGMVTGLNALLAGLAASLPTEVAQFSAALLPSNTTLCISAITSGSIIKWIYLRHVQAINNLSK